MLNLDRRDGPRGGEGIEKVAERSPPKTLPETVILPPQEISRRGAMGKGSGGVALDTLCTSPKPQSPSVIWANFTNNLLKACFEINVFFEKTPLADSYSSMND